MYDFTLPIWLGMLIFSLRNGINTRADVIHLFSFDVSKIVTLLVRNTIESEV